MTSGRSPISTIASAIAPSATAAQAGSRWRVQRASSAASTITTPITPSAHECWSLAVRIEPAAFGGRPARESRSGTARASPRRPAAGRRARRRGRDAERVPANAPEYGEAGVASARPRPSRRAPSVASVTRPSRALAVVFGQSALLSLTVVPGRDLRVLRALQGALRRESPGSPRNGFPTPIARTLAGQILQPGPRGLFFCPDPADPLGTHAPHHPTRKAPQHRHHGPHRCR